MDRGAWRAAHSLTRPSNYACTFQVNGRALGGGGECYMEAPSLEVSSSRGSLSLQTLSCHTLPSAHPSALLI